MIDYSKTFEEYSLNIGKRVSKTHRKNCEPKPFKSTFKINTVKGVIVHPIRGTPAYTFEEDESYVQCVTCEVV